MGIHRRNARREAQHAKAHNSWWHDEDELLELSIQLLKGFRKQYSAGQCLITRPFITISG
jgi:hypothetical protein